MSTDYVQQFEEPCCLFICNLNFTEVNFKLFSFEKEKEIVFKTILFGTCIEYSSPSSHIQICQNMIYPPIWSYLKRKSQKKTEL